MDIINEFAHKLENNLNFIETFIVEKSLFITYNDFLDLVKLIFKDNTLTINIDNDLLKFNKKSCLSSFYNSNLIFDKQENADDFILNFNYINDYQVLESLIINIRKELIFLYENFRTHLNSLHNTLCGHINDFGGYVNVSSIELFSNCIKISNCKFSCNSHVKIIVSGNSLIVKCICNEEKYRLNKVFINFIVDNYKNVSFKDSVITITNDFRVDWNKSLDILVKSIIDLIVQYFSSLQCFYFFSRNIKSRVVFASPAPSLGLCDRLRGIIFTYHYCKKYSIKFKISKDNIVNTKYLSPNSYDWVIEEDDKTFELSNSVDNYVFPSSTVINKKCIEYIMNTSVTHLLRINTNILDLTIDNKTLFNELFAPSEHVRKEIEKRIKILGKNFCSVTARFMNLLGDFSESENKINVKLNEDSKNRVLHIIANKIDEILCSLPNEYKLLVTSDSSNFLKYVSKLNDRCICFDINNKRAHPSISSEVDFTNSYCDLFLLIKSQKVYRLDGLGLYPSGFPYYASILGNNDFESIQLK